ncbi:hypothetical protein GOODEAATRI_029235, partial [Goodea atripinnis]
TIKQMVAKKYEEEQERVKMEVQQAVAVSLTAEMWTSVNMEAYLALTSTFVDPRFKSLGFRSSSKCNEAIGRLRSECGSIIGRPNEPKPGLSSQHTVST